MSDWNLFWFGLVVSFMCGVAARAPLLYAASKAELEWRDRKRQASKATPLPFANQQERPAASGLTQYRRSA
jgi:hypothetical protein